MTHDDAHGLSIAWIINCLYGPCALFFAEDGKVGDMKSREKWTVYDMKYVSGIATRCELIGRTARREGLQGIVSVMSFA